MSAKDANKPTPSPSPVIAELRGAGFRMPLPAGWVDRSVYCAAGPEQDGFQPTLTVTVQHAPDVTDIAVFAQDQLRQLAGQLDDYEFGRAEKRQIGTRPGYWAQFEWTGPDGARLHQQQWFMPKAPNVYIVTATAPAEKFAAVAKIFDDTTKGFANLAG